MKNILIVSKYTFVEVYKSKILLNIILLGFTLILISYIASEFSHGVQARVALDFGMGSMYLVIMGIAIFIGVSLLSKEVENRTAYMILSRPIRRWHFLAGKFLGMSAILFINVFLLGIIILAFYFFLGGGISSLMWWALLFNLLESQIILLVVIFFSLITNVTMAVIYTICIFLLGHILSATLMINFIKGHIIWINLLTLAKWIIPDFDKLNLRDYIIYHQSMPLNYLIGSLGYAILYIGFMLLLNIIVFERKELD